MIKFFQSILLFIICAPATTAIVGALVYVLYGLNKPGVYITSFISLIIIGFVMKHSYQNNETAELDFKKVISTITKKEWLVFGLFLISWLIAIYFLYTGRSDRAIITPWQVVSSWFFLFYGFGVVALFILSQQASKLLTLTLIFQSLLLFGVVAIVYRLGYGFDPFIHEAAVKAIEQFGQIKPLTPYYLGQYSIMTVLHNLTTISLAFWSKILVSGLAALSLPLVIMRWLKNHHGAEKDWGLAAVMLLILPATLFIITTPQNLAYLFLIIVLFWPSPLPTKNEKIIIWLCAVAALVTQPIAGIPAILIALADSTQNKTWDKYLYPLIITGFVMALPLAFYIFTALDVSTTVSLTWPNLEFLKTLMPTNPNLQSWWLNFIYLYDGLWALIILLLILIGSYLTIIKKSFELRRRFLWPALALVIAAIITAMINFQFLIDYERSDYALRLIITALLFSLPLILNALRELAVLVEKQNRRGLISWLIIITCAATASLYLSYPRFDHYYNSHGYASSKADHEAVKWIEAEANNEAYVVLANQQVSAAALREFGFKTYYHDTIFYYPIPTSGQLYQSYLAMMEEPNLKIIDEVKNLTGTNKVYLVLNSYWWDYKKLASEISELANSSKDIGSGQIIVFEF